MRLSRRIAVALLAVAAHTTALADYPDKPMRIIVPFPPGGTTDIVARAVAVRLTKSMGVTVVVENRAGAGGMIGTDAAAKGDKEGYTMLMAGSPHSINNSLRTGVPYDPVKSFEPVSLLGTVPLVLVVPAAAPAKTYEEFVSLGRQKPDSWRCGAVIGSANHLATELFRRVSGVPLLQVPYKGDAPMIVDLLGGHINCLLVISTQVLQQIGDGRFRALAVASPRRLGVLSEVRTLHELGLADFHASSWNGIFVPAGTPPDRIRLLSDKIVEASRDPEFVSSLGKLGFDVQAGGPAPLASFLDNEIAKWRKVIVDAKIEAN